MSLRNKVLKWGLRRFARPMFEDGLNLEKFRKLAEFHPDAKFMYPCTYREAEIAGVPVYKITPPEVHDHKLLVYLHGGAFVCEAGKDLWKFALRLSRELGQEMIFIRYRLAPEHPFPAAFDDCCNVLHELSRLPSSPKLQLVGESAGAGLALSVAMAIKEDVSIERMALLSPFSNLALDHPEIAEFEKRDPLMAASGLRAAGLMYAGTHDTMDRRLSPVNGELDGLPPTLIMMGTDDVSLGDARSFASRAGRAGWDLTYHEEVGMIHNWIAFPFIPEASRDRPIFIDYLSG